MKHGNGEYLSLKGTAVFAVGFGAFIVGLSFGGAKVTEMGFDSSDAERVAEQNGFMEAEVTEVNRLFPGAQGCGKGDLIGFEIEAIAPNGNPVTIDVCKGLFKGATIRQG
jgi:hypothetical protein